MSDLSIFIDESGDYGTNSRFYNVDVRKVVPSEYRLFQCADLICMLELLRAKQERSLPLTRSEEIFFGNRRTLNKDYLKQLKKFGF